MSAAVFTDIWPQTLRNLLYLAKSTTVCQYIIPWNMKRLNNNDWFAFWENTLLSPKCGSGGRLINTAVCEIEWGSPHLDPMSCLAKAKLFGLVWRSSLTVTLKLNAVFILHFVQIFHLPPHAFSSQAPRYKSYGFTASHTLGLSYRQGPGPGSRSWLWTETKKELVLILHSWISAGTKKIVVFSWELWHLQCVLPRC